MPNRSYANFSGLTLALRPIGMVEFSQRPRWGQEIVKFTPIKEPYSLYDRLKSKKVQRTQTSCALYFGEVNLSALEPEQRL